MLSLIGKKVVAIKSWSSDKHKKKGFHPVFIMFDDEETYIEFEDQDYYSFHDYDTSAKVITVYRNKKLWEEMMNNRLGYYPDADENFVF